jgi:hypothetical protein
MFSLANREIMPQQLLKPHGLLSPKAHLKVCGYTIFEKCYKELMPEFLMA